MGFRLAALIGVLAVIGLIIQTANAVQCPGQPQFVPSEHISAWERSEIAPPRLNALRGNSATHYYLYSHGAEAPLYVSIARADTLDAYRAPYLYLLDEDGRINGGDQQYYANRAYALLPTRSLYIGSGSGELKAIMHWVQAPGEDPVLYPTESPALLFGSMLTKKPVYVCDISVALSEGSNFGNVHGILVFLADAIDAQIKALPKN